MKKLQPKNSAHVATNTIIAVIIAMIVILTLFMLREIYPENPFIVKYFNKGYLVMEVLVFIGILWGIDIWRARRREKGKKQR